MIAVFPRGEVKLPGSIFAFQFCKHAEYLCFFSFLSGTRRSHWKKLRRSVLHAAVPATARCVYAEII